MGWGEGGISVVLLWGGWLGLHFAFFLSTSRSRFIWFPLCGQHRRWPEGFQAGEAPALDVAKQRCRALGSCATPAGQDPPQGGGWRSGENSEHSPARAGPRASHVGSGEVAVASPWAEETPLGRHHQPSRGLQATPEKMKISGPGANPGFPRGSAPVK